MHIRRRPPTPTVRVETLTYRIPVAESEPRHILEEIVWHKQTEVEALRERLPLVRLKQMLSLVAPPQDFRAALAQAPQPVALIAEVKKASPSKGVLCDPFEPVAIAQAYQAGGASCLSVLTDEKFFQGSGDILRQVRQAVSLPILCKEFIISAYQIMWARSLGADAILLIAAILSDQDLRYLLQVATQMGLSALIEVHTLEELDRVLALEAVTLIGINNRNLETFQVDLGTTQALLAARGGAIAQRNITVVAESGLRTPADLQLVGAAGARAVLVGESLVTQSDPAAATRQLLA